MTARTRGDPRILLAQGATTIGLRLETAQADRLLAFGEAVLAKNCEVNLTAARDLATLVSDHILDSLTLIPFIVESALCTPHSTLRIPHSVRPLLIDVGSGGGFPALPLAILLAGLDFVCIESVAKKARALEEFCAAMGFGHVTVLCDRAERAAHDARWREKTAWATARAVGGLATACELTLPFLRLGGRLLAQRGADAQAELATAGLAIAQLGGRADAVVAVQRFGVRGSRTVVVVEKVAPTPARFPRKAGMPAKRPLGEHRG